MNIEVRPTPALRRHRSRLIGAAVAVALGATCLLSVAELVDGHAPEPRSGTVSVTPGS